MEPYPVVIIGAGPAGLTAAMQLSRQGITPAIFEKNQIGGLLLNANLVENYPGFVEGISGPELVDLFQRQADRLGVQVDQEEVLSVTYEQDLFQVVTSSQEIQARYLVAATGTKARTLPENIFEGDFLGVLFVDVYPLIYEINKSIVIIGSGDAALDYALNLARHNKIIILNRSTKIKSLPLLWDRIQKVDSINYFSNREINQVVRDDSGRIMISAGKGSDTEHFECDYLLTAIGREPELGFYQGAFTKKVEELQDKKRLYFIGDLHNGSYRQTAIAVGDGIRAAMQIGQKLEKDNT